MLKYDPKEKLIYDDETDQVICIFEKTTHEIGHLMAASITMYSLLYVIYRGEDPKRVSKEIEDTLERACGCYDIDLTCED